ncbi:MAG: hypothetical protein IJ106_06840 [Parasporobacterium sp.]|nr:hypothetical protein [Parasporobacterium sp.]
MSDFEILTLVFMVMTLVVAVFAATTRYARCPFSPNVRLCRHSGRWAHFAKKNNRPQPRIAVILTKNPG